MAFNKEIHHRRSIRLTEYDYSQPNAYFVTICTFKKECLFGEVVDREMRLNEVGMIVANDWIHSGVIRNEIELDEWIIMPNHFHAVVWFRSDSELDGVRKYIMKNPLKWGEDPENPHKKFGIRTPCLHRLPVCGRDRPQ